MRKDADRLNLSCTRAPHIYRRQRSACREWASVSREHGCRFPFLSGLCRAPGCSRFEETTLALARSCAFLAVWSYADMECLCEAAILAAGDACMAVRWGTLDVCAYP